MLRQNICFWSPTKFSSSLKITLKNIDEVQLFYELFTIITISSSSASRVEKVRSLIVLVSLQYKDKTQLKTRMCQMFGPVRHSLLRLLLCGAAASAEEPWPVWLVWRTGRYKLDMIQNLGEIQRNLCSVTEQRQRFKLCSVQSGLFFLWDYFVCLLQREEFWSQHFTFFVPLTRWTLIETNFLRQRTTSPTWRYPSTITRSPVPCGGLWGSLWSPDTRTERSIRSAPRWSCQRAEAANALRSLGKLK